MCVSYLKFKAFDYWLIFILSSPNLFLTFLSAAEVTLLIQLTGGVIKGFLMITASLIFVKRWNSSKLWYNESKWSCWWMMSYCETNWHQFVLNLQSVSDSCFGLHAVLWLYSIFVNKKNSNAVFVFERTDPLRQHCWKVNSNKLHSSSESTDALSEH